MAEAGFPSLAVALIDRLEGHEALDVEFKLARHQLPNSLWETVSAFANTRGGWIILGVGQRDGQVVVEGLSDPDRLLQDLHNLMRNRQKISYAAADADDAAIEVLADEANPPRGILLRVPAAPRSARPVYINNNPYTGTFVRRHGGDYHCTKQEVDRMMREASELAADSTILPLYE